MNKIYLFMILSGVLLSIVGLFLIGDNKDIIFGEKGNQILEPQRDFSYIEDGAEVYINDSNVYIRSTAYGNQPTVQLKTYQYSGDVNIVLGFNTDKVIPKGAYFNPHIEEVQKSYTCEYEFNYTTSPKFFWCYKDFGNETYVMFNHSYVSGNLTEKTAYWFVNETVWNDVSGEFTKANVNFMGYNRWYYKKNFNVNAGQLYTLMLDLKPLDWDSYKYWIGIYPSGETIQEAIQNDHFYALDPWTSALNNSLVVAMKLDDTSGSVAVDSWEHYNGTILNSLNSTEGKDNTALNFTQADNNSVNVIMAGVSGAHLTISGWIWLFGNHTQQLHITSTTQDKNTYRLGLVSDSSGTDQYIVFSNGDPTEYGTYTSGIDMDGWHHFAFVYNGTGVNNSEKIKVYVDNVTRVLSFNKNVDATMVNLDVLQIGYWAFAGHNQQGASDEVYVWNRSLSTDEVSILFDDGFYGSGTPVTSPALNVTLNAPINSFNTSARTINFNATISATNLDVSNVSLWINGSIVSTNDSGVVGNYIFPYTFTEYGSYNWTVTTVDNVSAQWNATETRILNITDVFAINQNEPADNYNSTSTTVQISCGANDSVGALNVSIFVDSELYTTETGEGATNLTVIDSSVYSGGNHTWLCVGHNGIIQRNSTVRTFWIPYVNVTLEQPLDSAEVGVGVTDFIASAISYYNIANVTLWNNANGTWLARNTTSQMFISGNNNSNGANAEDCLGVLQGTGTWDTNSGGWCGENFTSSTYVTNISVLNMFLYASGNISIEINNGTWVSLYANNSGLLDDPNRTNITVVVDKEINAYRVLFYDTQGGGVATKITAYGRLDSPNITFSYYIVNDTIWNYKFCDINGLCSFASANRTALIEENPPLLNLTYPTGDIPYAYVGGTLDVNWTVSDASLDDCWYQYNGSNTTVTCGDNHDTITVIAGQTDLTFYANDTSSNIAINYTNWTYNTLEISRTFNTLTVSGVEETFGINTTFSASFDGLSAILVYDGDEYVMTTEDTGNTLYFTTSFSAPAVTGEEIKTFYYILTLENATGDYNTTTYSSNQTVTSFSIDDCSLYNITLMNFYMYDEDTLAGINGTINAVISLYSFNTTDLVSEVNLSYNYVVGNASKVCLGNLSTNYSMKYQIQYFGDETLYFKKYKNIQRATVSNDTLNQNISLYNLNKSKGYAFNIIVVGNLLYSFGNSGLLVDTQRQYLALNQFLSVESSITSSEGIAVSHMIQNDEVYNFIISYNGIVLGTFNNYRVKCSNAYVDQCAITLNLAQSTADPPDFINYNNVSSVYLLDRNNNILYHTFSSTDGESKTVRSVVIKADGYGNTTICNNSLTGTSGTIQCTIPASYQNSSFFVMTYVNGDYSGSKFFSQGVNAEWYGADILIIMLMFSSLVLLLIAHPITIVIGAILGLVMPVALIYVTGASYGAIIGALLFYIGAGIIAIIIIGRKQ